MIVIDEQIPLIIEALSSVDEVTAVNGRSITNDLLCDTNASALFVRSTTTVDASLLANTNVNFVASATAGIDHVDLELLQERNIPFAYAAGSNAPAVVDYVLECLQHLDVHANTILGIVGHGHVGSLLRETAVQNGMTVLVNDPPLLDSGCLNAEGALIVEDLEDLLRGCDVASVHVPLITTGHHPTYHLIGRHEMMVMKSHATLINTSRGGVVSEADIFALDDAQRPNLILDVFEDEPDVRRSILDVCNIATPHIAGYTTDAKMIGALMVLAAYAQYLGRSIPLTPSTPHAKMTTSRLNSSLTSMWKDGYGANEFDALRAEYLREH